MRLLLMSFLFMCNSVLLAQNEDRADFIFNYYGQDGDHSAVTGGQGTQELEDISLDVTVHASLDTNQYLVWTAHANYYTSASTDRIDFIMSSASSEDLRVSSFMGLGTQKEDVDVGGGLGGSIESDYVSFHAAFWWNKELKGGRNFGLHADQYFDTWIPYFPSEIRGTERASLETEKRRTTDISLTYGFPLGKRSKLGLVLNPSWQNGLISTPFHRVYFEDSDVVDIERLPGDRLSLPVAVQWNSFLTTSLVTKLYYRYFLDNYGQQAHTLQIEIPYKINTSFTVRPFFRYHFQTTSRYFEPFAQHSIQDVFYTSDWDFGRFTSSKAGVSLMYYPLYPLWDSFKWIEIRYLIYRRNDGLKANALSVGTRVNF